jgi:cysteine desulfurase/selenocysteine lyase
MEYVESVGFEAIAAHEHDLLHYATERLGEIPEVRILGTAEEKASLVSFLVDGIHAHDVGTILDQDGIAVRAGHHCAQPVMDRFGIPGTARASFSFYNTRGEIDRLVASVRHALEIFS